MSSESTWAAAAATVMTEKLLECRAAGMTPEQTAKAIDAAYPFGEREHWPYKAWLAERRRFFAAHGLPRRGNNKSMKEQVDDLIAKMAEKRHWKQEAGDAK